jgi:thiamine kinase-like enzyme
MSGLRGSSVDAVRHEGQSPHNRTLQKHPAVRAWHTLDPRAASPTSIALLRSKNSDTAVYRLAWGHAADRAVIAKRGPAESIAVERVVYEEVLSRTALPTPRFYGTTPADEQEAWLFAGEAVGDEYNSADHRHRAAAAKWLALFHTSTSQLNLHDRLPGREPGYYLQHLRAARAEIVPRLGTGRWTHQVDATFRALVEQCDLFESRWHEVEKFFARVPRTVLHGDLCLANVRVQRLPNDVGLVPFDWEDAGWGVPAVDLAQFHGEPISYSARPDLPTYRSIVADAWPSLDAQDLCLLAEFGTVFQAVSELWWESWRLSYAYQSDRERAWFTEFVDCARFYGASLEQAAAAAGWTR